MPIRPRPARALRPVRTRLPRTALPWWLAVATLALLTGALVDGVLDRARAAEARWGESRSVLVATTTIAPGGSINADHTELRRLPGGIVPAGALHVRPGTRVATAAIGEGEIVIASRVSGEQAGGVSALLPKATRALVVPLEQSALPVRVGDRVDLLATGVGGPAGDFPVEPGSSGGAGDPVAEAALVVAVRDEALVVAVPRSAAPGVAAALGQGPVVPALVGPEG